MLLSQSSKAAAKLPRANLTSWMQSKLSIQYMTKAFKCSSNSGLSENKDTTNYRKPGMFFVHVKILEPSLEVVGPSLSGGIYRPPNSLTLAQGYTYSLGRNRTTTQITQESLDRRKSR